MYRDENERSAAAAHSLRYSRYHSILSSRENLFQILYGKAHSQYCGSRGQTLSLHKLPYRLCGFPDGNGSLYQKKDQIRSPRVKLR